MDDFCAALRARQIPFELIRHASPLRSASEGAAYLGIAPGQTAPALLLRTDRGYCLLVKSGDRGRVDMAALAARLGCQSVQLASAGEVREMTGFAVGSVPLLGHPFPYIVDRRLFRYPFIYGGTGDANCTLRVSPDAIAALQQVVAFLE